MRFRASFVHVGVKIEPHLAPRCPNMNPKMSHNHSHLAQVISARVPSVKESAKLTSADLVYIP